MANTKITAANIDSTSTGFTLADLTVTGGSSFTSLSASGTVTLDASVASGNFLTDATIYPLRLTNDDTTAGNAVALTFGQGGYDFTNFIASIRTGTGDNPKGDLVFGGRPSDGSPFVERLRILANGHVGIGTDNPGYALDISNTTSAKINLQGGTNQNGIRFAAAGNDGVSSSTYYFGAGSDLMSGTDYGSVFLDITNNRSVLFDDQSNSRLGFYNNSMVINSSGNVGIGTDSPSTDLSIFNSSPAWNQYATLRLATETEGTYYGEVSFHRGTSDDTDRGLVFNLGGTERMRILDTGDVSFQNSLQFEHGGEIKFKSQTTYDTIYTAIGYSSQSYSDTDQRYWNHLISRGGTHITINSDGGHTASENNHDDFVIWQGTQDIAEPLFRVSNTGRVIAKQNYEIGNHKTNKEEFGVSAINTVDTATSDINTTTTNTYENRPGVYWLNFNSKRFRAFIKPNWLQNRNWVLAAKFFSHMDMPSGSSLWTNDTSWNGGDFDLNNGHFSKYGNVWRYFGFNRLAMQMGDRVAPIMQFSSTQTLYGAFSGGRAANGGGVSPTSTDPALSTGATYHGMTNFLGGTFTDLGGLEDKMQSYGLNKWANNSTNSTSANNQGSRSLTAGGKGFELTVEDSHDNIGGNDSIGYAGAWIGCPLDEGNCNPLATASNGGADSGFGFGGGCGNNARTWTSGIAEWGRGNEVANYLPAYIWLSID